MFRLYLFYLMNCSLPAYCSVLSAHGLSLSWVLSILLCFRAAYYKTRNTGTRNYGTWNTSRTPNHWRKIQPNTGRTIGIPRNSGTCEEQWNNVTTKQHQEILSIQTDAYWTDKITKFNTRNLLKQEVFLWKS